MHAHRQMFIVLLFQLLRLKNKNKNKEMPLNSAAFTAFCKTHVKNQLSCLFEMQFG